MFFLFVFIILIVLSIMIYTSRIGIEIQNLIIDTEKVKGEKINKDSKIYIYLLIFKKIKLFKKNIREIDKQKMKFKSKDIKMKILKNKDLKVNYKYLLQKIDIDIEQIDLNIQFGTEDAAFTAILTGIISSIFGMVLRKPKYEIIPIYTNRNIVKIKLDCIFSIYLMQYIYKLIANKIKDLEKDSLKKKVEV